MHVQIIPCLTDNYSYLAGANATGDVVAVDPCDPEVVLRAVLESGRRLVAIFNTHHHSDHVGGNLALLAAFPGIPVYAHREDRGRIPGQTHEVEEGQELTAAGLNFRVLFIPGHTRAHIAYVTDGAAFVGDTVFGAGCGRMFEGTPEVMHASLQKIAALPGDTRLYFAHEYTASNLRFAAHVEPTNLAIATRTADVALVRQAGGYTTPSNVALEQATNPFLRVNEHSVRKHFESETGADAPPWAVFGAVRRAKDHFR